MQIEHPPERHSGIQRRASFNLSGPCPFLLGSEFTLLIRWWSSPQLGVAGGKKSRYPDSSKFSRPRSTLLFESYNLDLIERLLSVLCPTIWNSGGNSIASATLIHPKNWSPREPATSESPICETQALKRLRTRTFYFFQKSRVCRATLDLSFLYLRLPLNYICAYAGKLHKEL